MWLDRHARLQRRSVSNDAFQVVGCITEIVRASPSRKTQDESDSRLFLLRFVPGPNAGSECAKKKWRTQSESRTQSAQSRQSFKNRSKIDELSMKVRSWAVWAPRAHSGTRLERPWDAKLGRLGGQVGWFGLRVGGSGCQVGCLECQVGPLG